MTSERNTIPRKGMCEFLILGFECYKVRLNGFETSTEEDRIYFADRALFLGFFEIFNTQYPITNFSS